MTDEPDPTDRRAARRWYARIAITVAVGLIGGGALMVVAGSFLFAGWEPRWLKR